ncbi:cytoskeleton-associated protein 2-like [Saccostrea cucullata]|uniref:cytoskeleton-associated protein 2-like n=1 Tax=Saccostrea cuccullata TaxID=36930 RepID=UPI002ED2B36F
MLIMEKLNSAKVKKATEFLEKWKKFQEQKRHPLSTKLTAQDDIEKKKAGKKVVASRYLSHRSESNVPKEPTAPAQQSKVQKRISILPQKQTNGTPMSIKLERWKKKKENEKENRAIPRSVRKKTQTPFKSAQKYTHVKSKFMTASSQKTVQREVNRKTEKETVKKVLTSTMKSVSIKTVSSEMTRVTKSTSQTKPTNLTKTSGAKKNFAMSSPKKYKSSHFQFKVGDSETKELKRRHSDLESRNTKVTRSILKRKSCLPSLSDEALVPDSQTPKTPGHNVRFVSPVKRKPDTQTLKKTPVRHQHRSMRTELEEWLKKKGKTPSGFRHLRCFDASLSAKKKSSEQCYTEEKTHKEEIKPRSSVVLNLEDHFNAEDSITSEDTSIILINSCKKLNLHVLSKCTIFMRLFLTELIHNFLTLRTIFQGCPLEDTMKWLDSIEDNITMASSSARFYICKAKILKSTNNLEEVLQVFEKAVKNSAQPAEDLARSLTEIITEISLERERKARLKSALDKAVEDGNVFESSTIKYCVRQLTPHKYRKRPSGGFDDFSPLPCKVVTPVRRSTRRSLSGLPDQLQDKTPVYTALEDIPSPERKGTLFQSNSALDTDLDEDL